MTLSLTSRARCVILAPVTYLNSKTERKERGQMTNAVYIMTIGIADAGRLARAVLTARGFGEGSTLPTFRLLRS
jgi:hypothetical protein